MRPGALRRHFGMRMCAGVRVHGFGFGICDLEFGIYLGFGILGFGIFIPLVLPPLNSVLKPRLLPWLFLPGGVFSVAIQAQTAWQHALVYDRNAILGGEWWRVWTGNFVHFGWLHCLLDTGLYFLIGWTLVYNYKWWLNVFALVFMPLAVTFTLFFFEPGMVRYGGISGMNVGFLVWLALAGWQRSWRDWFWPAFLGIHVAELIWEAYNGGQGGGAIRFDDPTIRIATLAHVGGAAFGIVMWGVMNLLGKRVLTVESLSDLANLKRATKSETPRYP